METINIKPNKPKTAVTVDANKYIFKQTLLIKREISNQILSHLTIENMEMKMQEGLRHSAV